MSRAAPHELDHPRRLATCAGRPTTAASGQREPVSPLSMHRARGAKRGVAGLRSDTDVSRPPSSSPHTPAVGSDHNSTAQQRRPSGAVRGTQIVAAARLAAHAPGLQACLLLECSARTRARRTAVSGSAGGTVLRYMVHGGRSRHAWSTTTDHGSAGTGKTRRRRLQWCCWPRPAHASLSARHTGTDIRGHCHLQPPSDTTLDRAEPFAQDSRQQARA